MDNWRIKTIDKYKKNEKKLKLEKVNGKKAYRFLTHSNDEVYIGNPEEKTQFKPQLLLKKWLDECFIKLSIGNISKELNFEEENNYLIWENEWFTVKVYPIDKTEVRTMINGKEHIFIQNEQGGLEFEAILKTRPPFNSFSFPIETKGLKFYYQPSLTEEFKKENCEVWTETYVKTKDGEECFRPENVVGSYAVYHTTRTNIHRNKVDAEKYKAGKVFHIYRPKTIDAEGKTVWCDLHIDETKGLLKVTIPKEFLDKAVYPVTIDPTFGYETVGGSTMTQYQRMRGMWDTCPESGTADSITVYLEPFEGNPGASKCVLYKKSDSSKVAETEEKQQGDLTVDAWNTYNFGTSPNLENVDYWIIIGFDGNTDNRYGFAYDTITGKGGYQDITYPTFPTTASFTLSDLVISIYCTYTTETQEIYRTFSIVEDLKKHISRFFSLIHSMGTKIISDFSDNLDMGLLVDYIKQNLSGLFKIKNQIYKPILIQFKTFKRILQYLMLNFRIFNYRIKELFIKYNLKAIIIKYLNNIHSIIIKVIKRITIQYSIISFIQKILNIIYSSGLFIEALMNLSYFLIIRVKKTFSLVNNILSYISKFISSLFKIREFRESLLVLLNNIKNILRKTIKILYLSKRVVYSLFSTSYKIKKLLIKIFISISDISITEIIYKIQNISYSLAGLLGKLLLINYTIKEFLSSIFKILYSIKIFIGRIVLFNYLAKQYTIVSTILKYNTRKFIRSVSKILYNNLKYLTSIFEVVYIVPKVIVTIFLILNHIIKRISTIFSTLYSVGFLKIYSILSLKFGVIRKLTILTLKLKQILPRFKLSTLQKTLKVKLDTLKYRIKEILRRG